MPKLGSQEWEKIVSEFPSSSYDREKWTSLFPVPEILDHGLQTLSRDDVSGSTSNIRNDLKMQVAIFLEENLDHLTGNEPRKLLQKVFQCARTATASSANPQSFPASLQAQIVCMATSIFIQLEAVELDPLHMQAFIELLLLISMAGRSRSSYSHTLRSSACQCLQAIEAAWPCILSQCVGHFLDASIADNSPALQSYLLLLLTSLQNVASFQYFPPPKTSTPMAARSSSPATSPGYSLPSSQLSAMPPSTPTPVPVRRQSPSAAPSLLSTVLQLSPYTLPTHWAHSSTVTAHGWRVVEISQQELIPAVQREFRRAISDILERSHLLTEASVAHLIWGLTALILTLGMASSLLVHHIHFSALRHCSSPSILHSLLQMHLQLGGEEQMLQAVTHLLNAPPPVLPTVFRHLALHWLVGGLADLENGASRLDPAVLAEAISECAYPALFDTLALKSDKMEAMAACAALLADSPASAPRQHRDLAAMAISDEDSSDWLQVGLVTEQSLPPSPDSLFPAAMACVEGFRHLPAASLEAAMAFHTIQTFLTLPGSTQGLHPHIEATLVDGTLTHPSLIPRLLALLQSLHSCHSHRWLGCQLLASLSSTLLARLAPDTSLLDYFPLLERLVAEEGVDPSPVLFLTVAYCRGQPWPLSPSPGRELNQLWLAGDQVLSLCRTAMAHHPTSRLFEPLCNLLGFMAHSFPELGARDSARFMLRLLTTLPGPKLRHLLTFTESDSNLMDHSQLADRDTLEDRVQADSLAVSDFVSLARLQPAVLHHSWELHAVPQSQEGREEPQGEQPSPDSLAGQLPDPMELLLLSYFGDLLQEQESPTVSLQCRLHYFAFAEGDYCGVEGEGSNPSPESPPWRMPPWVKGSAIYGIRLLFQCSQLYSPIPPAHVPFALKRIIRRPVARPPGPGRQAVTNLLLQGPLESMGSNEVIDEVASFDGRSVEEESVDMAASSGSHGREQQEEEQTQQQEEDLFSAVSIRLQPLKPVPALVSVQAVFSDEEGWTVEGILNSVPIAIHDLFLPRWPTPTHATGQHWAATRQSLFLALWELFGPSMAGRADRLRRVLRGAVQAGGEDLLGQVAQSVKILDVGVGKVVEVVEEKLVQFVVCVEGGALADVVGRGGDGWDVVWSKDCDRVAANEKYYGGVGDECLGTFQILVFLPPKYHFLMLMRVFDGYTSVEMRTDYWPCLAYVDEYLEALVDVDI